MKWFTKRALLQSSRNMPGAMSAVLIGFVDKLKSDGHVHLWYTSLKSDDGNPSVRVYLQIDDDKEELVQAQLDTFLQENADEMGWAGDYFSPDPALNPSYPHLNEINIACELVLRLVKQYPNIDRVERQDFWRLAKAEVGNCISSMDPAHHGAFVHFIANNLCLTDDSFVEMLRSI